ncbi:MAG: 30S ribosomal protein S9 [Phycisphaerales bacterium]|nr:30S ribosomal protein S9 [Phycisphaerales bacterium]
MEKQNNLSALGRRKEAVARIILKKGTGIIKVNKVDLATYFKLEYLQKEVIAPLEAIESLGKFDVKINAKGGGLKGQAEAAKLGIARALVEHDPNLKPIIKTAGYLTRDPRGVERKKFGHKKARRSFQFSKR